MLINSIAAIPFANLIRCQAMLQGAGICAIGVDSINSLENANIQSHRLLAHLLTGTITAAPHDLTLHEVRLDAGPVGLKDIYNRLSRIKVDTSKATKGSILQATGSVRFYVVTGTYSLSKPLTSDIVREFILPRIPSSFKIIEAALPFLSPNPIKYQITERPDGLSDVTFEGISPDEVRRMMQDMTDSITV